MHGFESRYVSEIVRYISYNNNEALVDFINNHSDEQLIKVRADLKEYIGKSNSMSNLLAVLSIYVAVVVAVFSSLHSKLSDLYVEHAAFWIAIFTVPMIVCFFMYTKPHRIGKYHRALSMLEDYCKKMGRLQ